MSEPTMLSTLTPRPMPWRRAERVVVSLPSGERSEAPAGTRVGEVLPTEIGGARVVAALLDERVVSLTTQLVVDARVAPLPVSHWEGERVYRRSLGLALLEASRAMAAPIDLRLGPSIGFGQKIELPPLVDPARVVDELRAALVAIVREDRPFREEWWTVEEARQMLARDRMEGAAKLLARGRDALVRLASCGDLRVLSLGPCVPSTAWLDRVSIGVSGHDAYLVYRDEPRLRAPTLQLVAASAPTKRATDMGAQHERWLARLGVVDVGTLGDVVLGGNVADLVDVSEGFHEKRIGDIAEEIATRPVPAKVITIAGPSSAGKTTFIKRLSTQLRVMGVRPRAISLDDYFRDRGETIRGPDGQPDWEAFEALDVPLLHGHFAQILEGARVRTARYDFAVGKVDRHGGPEIQLEPGDILLVEGLHGLNPGLFRGLLDERDVFRVFVNPSTSLAFDALSRVNASDVRLLRRIVRDRRQRAISPSENILRWPSVRRGERLHIFPHLGQADAVFDSSLVYEPSVLKVFAERYLLEVAPTDAAYVTAHRLRLLLDQFIAIDPDHVPRGSLLREFIGPGQP